MFSWLINEGGYILSWWLLVTLAGAAALPLCLRLLGGLPDRGYTLARAAGLLLVGFVFWLLASFGFLRNTPGAMLFAWVIVLVVGLLVYFRAGEPMPGSQWRAWWRENRSVILTSELLFIVLFFGWAVVRAYQNGLTGTEKPMELMFINSVVRSDTFPPNDAWMAGYAISYYYFGYVMAAMLGLLSGVNSTLGFNLLIALLFALTGVTAFGVTYNLVRSRAFDWLGNLLEKGPSRQVALGIGTLGMIFVVLLGNFYTPLVELPYQTGAATTDYLQFWGVDERQSARTDAEAGSLDPATWNFWWWFRAARVLNDLDINGNHIEVIDEFPQFSFLLADNHPHVLALPFVMLAIGMAVNLVLRRRDPSVAEIIFYGLCIGGLSFLNTWDGPVYLIALVGADGLRRLMVNDGRLYGRDWVGLVWFGVILLVIGIGLYLPFWLGFRSQASGFLPNLINPTRTQQFFLMFGPFLLLLPPFLIAEAWRGRRRTNWGFALGATGLILLALLVVMILLIGAASFVPALRTQALQFVDSAGGWDGILPLLISRRVEAILTTVLLLVGIAAVLARLFPRQPRDTTADDTDARVTYAPATGFALLLVGIGLVLTITPEFIYLRDNFGTRMNTIFKFYYQAWLVFSIASAYAIYTLLFDQRNRLPAPSIRAVYSALTVAVLTLGLIYPVYGVYSRMIVETGRASATAEPIPPTLDGGRTFVMIDDYEAIRCFSDYVDSDEVVVAEAVGPAYRPQFGRVGALTGVPILLGWENHQRQWRGATYPVVAGSRAEDIRTLYETDSWDVAQSIIARYDLDYIFFGQSERTEYGVTGEDKFRDNMDVVCEVGNSRFYRVRADVQTAVR